MSIAASAATAPWGVGSGVEGSGVGFLSSRRAERPAGAVDARWRRWVMRDALRRPGTLAAASTTGFVSLVVATLVDSSTGGGVSVVADVTLALAAAVLGGLWFDLPRSQQADVARSIRRLLGLSTVSLIVFAGVYLLAQRSAFGQRFERDVLLGRGAGATGLQGGASAILDQVTAGAVALLAGAVCCVAVVRGRLGLALATGLAVVLTLASAAVLKSLLLSRPVLLGSDAVATARSYPSGHVAAAAALGCAAVVVAPVGWRLRATGVAVALTGVVGVAVLFAGWHRPSDAIGGVATAMCWFGVVAAILVRNQRRPSWRGSGPDHGFHPGSGWSERIFSRSALSALRWSSSSASRPASTPPATWPRFWPDRSSSWRSTCSPSPRSRPRCRATRPARRRTAMRRS